MGVQTSAVEPGPVLRQLAQRDSPVWRPDGTRVAFFAPSPCPWTLYARAADASQGAEPLLRMPRQAGAAAHAPEPESLLPGSLPTLSGIYPHIDGLGERRADPRVH